MTNLHRGEIACLIGGRPLRLCLTLGALAEIEAAFGCDGLAALGERLSSGRMRASDLIAILAPPRAGAPVSIDDAALRASRPHSRCRPSLRRRAGVASRIRA